jgi:hypothetical protein
MKRKSIFTIALSALNTRSTNTYMNRNTGGRSFLTLQQNQEEDEQEDHPEDSTHNSNQEESTTTIKQDGQKVTIPSWCCFIAKKQGRSTTDTKKDKLLQNALVAVSMAKQALQEASGMKFPMK